LCLFVRSPVSPPRALNDVNSEVFSRSLSPDVHAREFPNAAKLHTLKPMALFFSLVFQGFLFSPSLLADMSSMFFLAGAVFSA